MEEWQVNKISKLTGVSVQTLHYYDRIGILQPSFRSANGYRLYRRKDLIRLQQIVAIKFLGFPLSKIKKLLIDKEDMRGEFITQKRRLEEKANVLLEASRILGTIIKANKLNESIPIEELVKSIKVYDMTKKLEQTWVKEIFDEKELKQYAEFRTELENRGPEAKEKSLKNWQNLVEKINQSIGQDTTSKNAIEIAEAVMNHVNSLYGAKHANLKQAIWERGFKTGKAAQDYKLSTEAVAWLDKAIYSYWKKRITAILDQIHNESDEPLSQKWNALILEMAGDSEEIKQEILGDIFSHKDISGETKEWVKRYTK